MLLCRLLEYLADPSQWLALYGAGINGIDHDFIQVLAKAFDGLKAPFFCNGLDGVYGLNSCDFVDRYVSQIREDVQFKRAPRISCMVC